MPPAPLAQDALVERRRSRNPRAKCHYTNRRILRESDVRLHPAGLSQLRLASQLFPADLERRGFPVEDLLDQDNTKFHNYAYGKQILLMWQVLRKFVASFLANGGQGFDTDEKVASDADIKRWCDEMRSDDGGQMKSWPVIKTVDQLVDCVTMCIRTYRLASSAARDQSA